MSTISRAHRIRLGFAAATLAFALVGGLASAFAQTAGGGQGGHGGSAGQSEGSGSGSAVLVYGTPGNCPPTIACGEPRRPPRIVKVRPYDPCGDHRPGSDRHLRCIRQF